MGRGGSSGSGQRWGSPVGGGGRGVRPDRIVVVGALLAGLRRLRAAGLLGGREFDLWLVALRLGSARPAEAAARLGLPADLMRTRISRWVARGITAGLVERDEAGVYRLTPVGARRADEIVRQLRLVMRSLTSARSS